MKLDRNLNADGHGKYGLILNRKLAIADKTEAGSDIAEAIRVLEEAGILDWGTTPQTEFFVMRLKDRFAQPALNMYSQHAMAGDMEYAAEVGKLAKRAGMSSPFCKDPD